MSEEPTVYVSVRGPGGQLVVSGPLVLLREFLASVREYPDPRFGGVVPPVVEAEHRDAVAV